MNEWYATLTQSSNTIPVQTMRNYFSLDFIPP